MNPNYVIKYVDRTTEQVYINSASPYFQDGKDTEGYRNECRRDCKKCHGRGFEVWDQNQPELYQVVCRRLQNVLENKEKQVAEFN